jgi:DNA-binding NarL/FixJ family response regulator
MCFIFTFLKFVCACDQSFLIAFAFSGSVLAISNPDNPRIYAGTSSASLWIKLSASRIMPDIRVVIIEDQAEMREGLAALIERSEGFVCAHRFASMEEALSELDSHDPADVALVDIGLPGLSGIEGLPLLRERFPRLQVLMLTVYGDDGRIFKAMCAGACGYLLKKTPPARLLESLREVAAGGSPMSPEVARRVIELFRMFRPALHDASNLTPQEMRLLTLLGHGHHYKTAAGEMGISIHTVGFYMRRIYEKLQVHSKSEAVAKAFREGLLR